jgi:Fe-S-cluster containining protein
MEIKEIKGHEKCSKICKAVCCNHVSIEIERPTIKKDFDHIRWLLTHKNISVFIDNQNKWCLDFKTECEYLTVDNDCGIYEMRPNICAEYPPKNYICEYDSTDENSLIKACFETSTDFENYLDKKGKQWRFKQHLD